MITPIAALAPEIGFAILPEGDFSANAARLLEVIHAKAEKCRAFVVGPGLGDDDYALALVASLLGINVSTSHHTLGFGVPRPAPDRSPSSRTLVSLARPILIDADGLNALAKLDEWWNQVPPHSLVLTPHVGELSRLLDVSADDILRDPAGAAQVAAQRFRQVVLLKGAPTLVTDGRSIAEAHDSPTSLATAGTGDVLSGTIGALLAQGLTLTDAANLGVYLGARAARRVEREYGTLGLIAGDIPRAIAIELAALGTP
jgi:NAD(P)H-hydrate epimerase